MVEKRLYIYLSILIIFLIYSLIFSFNDLKEIFLLTLAGIPLLIIIMTPVILIMIFTDKKFDGCAFGFYGFYLTKFIKRFL